MSTAFVSRHWQRRSWVSIALYPVSLLFRTVTFFRRLGYRRGWFKQCRSDVPVVVVGNIIAGGAGKTPLTIALVTLLRDHGWQPGVVSRGYGSTPSDQPILVGAESTASDVGDEPLLIAEKTQVPVVVYPKRCQAIEHLLNTESCNILVCDDGLQHYAMARDLEIAVINTDQQHGNGWCLPAGPLRETPARLTSVDMIVTSGVLDDTCSCRSGVSELVNLSGDAARPLETFKDVRAHAVAGIANPQRFFSALEAAGLVLTRHVYADHHDFVETDVVFSDDLPVIMTEKDAVKCRHLPIDLTRYWKATLTTELSDRLRSEFLSRVERLKSVSDQPDVHA